MSSKLGDLPMYLDVDVVFLTDTNMRIRGQTSPSWVIIMVHFFHFIYLFTTFILKQSFSLKWKGQWWGREVLRCSIQFYWMQWNICSSRGHYCLMLQSICLYISASLFFPAPPPQPKACPHLPRLPLLLPLPAGRRWLCSSYRLTWRSRGVRRAGGCALIPPHPTPDIATTSQPPHSPAASRLKPRPLLRLLQSALRWVGWCVCSCVRTSRGKGRWKLMKP